MAQPFPEALGQLVERQGHPELRAELVDRPVGLDPRMRLGNPAHVAQVGLAAVAEARVDAGQVDRHAWPGV